MNAERRIQRVRAALRPIGAVEARLADHLRGRARDGRTRASSSRAPKTSGTRSATLCEGARGMTLRAARRGGPAVAVSRPRITRARRILHARAFAIGARAPPAARSTIAPTPETSRRRVSAAADHRAVALSVQRRHDDAAHAATTSFAPRPARHLAGRRRTAAACDGERVRVVSRYGSAVLPVHVGCGAPGRAALRDLSPGRGPAERVTGPHRDPSPARPSTRSPRSGSSACRRDRRGTLQPVRSLRAREDPVRDRLEDDRRHRLLDLAYSPGSPVLLVWKRWFRFGNDRTVASALPPALRAASIAGRFCLNGTWTSFSPFKARVGNLDRHATPSPGRR